MSLNEEVEVLRKISLLADVEPSKLKLLAFASQLLSFEDGEVLFRQGDMGDAAYVIIEGEAEVSVDSPSGPMTIATVPKHGIVGEIAILCDVPRTATVIAKGQMKTLVIEKELFLRLIKEFPSMSLKIVRELAYRLDRTTRQLRDAMSGP